MGKKLLTSSIAMCAILLSATGAFALPAMPGQGGLPGQPPAQQTPNTPQQPNGPQQPNQPQLPPCVECNEFLGSPTPTKGATQLTPTPTSGIGGPPNTPTPTPKPNDDNNDNDDPHSNGGGGGGSSSSGTGGAVLGLAATDGEGVPLLTASGVLCMIVGISLYGLSRKKAGLTS